MTQIRTECVGHGLGDDGIEYIGMLNIITNTVHYYAVPSLKELTEEQPLSD